MEMPIKKASKRVDRSLLNEDITAPNVRLVGAGGEQRGVVSRAEALAEAQAAGLDLVLVAAEAEPPVCKVMDYGKHLFELKKTKAAQRKKQKQIQVKEMKFRPGTEEGDYQVKLRNLKRFLEEGDKAKVSLRFRARSRSPRNRHVTNEPNCRGPRRARVGGNRAEVRGSTSDYGIGAA